HDPLPAGLRELAAELAYVDAPQQIRQQGDADRDPEQELEAVHLIVGGPSGPGRSLWGAMPPPRIPRGSSWWAGRRRGDDRSRRARRACRVPAPRASSSRWAPPRRWRGPSG